MISRHFTGSGVLWRSCEDKDPTPHPTRQSVFYIKKMLLLQIMFLIGSFCKHISLYIIIYLLYKYFIIIYIIIYLYFYESMIPYLDTFVRSRVQTVQFPAVWWKCPLSPSSLTPVDHSHGACLKFPSRGMLLCILSCRLKTYNQSLVSNQVM